MRYISRIQNLGADYINGLRAEPFIFNGDEYAFFFYEIHRVSWCLSAGMGQVEVWTANAEPRTLSRSDAQAWLEVAARLMTDRSREFHRG